MRRSIVATQTCRSLRERAPEDAASRHRSPHQHLHRAEQEPVPIAGSIVEILDHID